MPRPGPPKPSITIRLHRHEIARLDKLAEEQGTTRTEVVRKAIALLPGSSPLRPLTTVSPAPRVTER